MVLDDDTFLQDCNLKENFSLRLRRGCVVGRTNVKVPTKDNEKPIGSEVSKYECEDA